VDFGTLDDLNAENRQLYVENILPLTRAGSLFFLWCFQWPPRWWEKFYPFPMFLEPGEVEQRFASWFEIERLDAAGKLDRRCAAPRRHLTWFALAWSRFSLDHPRAVSAWIFLRPTHHLGADFAHANYSLPSPWSDIRPASNPDPGCDPHWRRGRWFSGSCTGHLGGHCPLLYGDRFTRYGWSPDKIPANGREK
jgi:hypothetical protein